MAKTLQNAIILFTLLVTSLAIRINLVDSSSKSVLYIPLDERFTTRDAFLNLAKVPIDYC